MSLNPKLSSLAANAEIDSVTALLADGYLRIYNGVQPADVDTPVSTQTKLAELRFGNPAFSSGVDGVAVSNALTADDDAEATGTASWYRLFKSDGVTPISDGSVGVTGANLNLNSVSIQIHASVTVGSVTLRASKG